MTKKEQLISQIRLIINVNEKILDCDEYMLSDMITEIIKQNQ